MHGIFRCAEVRARFLYLRDVSLGVDRTVLTSLALPKAMHAHTTVAGVARQSRLRGKRAIFSVYHEKTLSERTSEIGIYEQPDPPAI